MNGLRQTAFTLALFSLFLNRSPAAAPARQVEKLSRGLVALKQTNHTVWTSWRLLAGDPDSIQFNVYRQAPDGPAKKLNAQPIADVTWFIDAKPDEQAEARYFVRAIVDGTEGPPGRAAVIPAGAAPQGYLSVPLQTPPGYAPNDASVGDLDGDGDYEIVLHQAGRGRDNSQRGVTDPPILEAYKLDGALLWRIRLGPNIREGAHYTQFLVYDLDGDGRAEVVCKTADGTIDGTGKVIGDASADHRNASGYILRGPEFLTVFDGKTGRELATVPYIPERGKVSDWGDDYGNRVDRFLACVAYLDGSHPSVVFCRGYYTRSVIAAWDFRDQKLTSRWVFDTRDAGNEGFAGQGNHNLAVGDVDGDGKDEIVYGSMCVDDDGHGLWTTGLGHGDAIHLSDLDPRHPGLEVFDIHERPDHEHGIDFRDARTGKILWSKPSTDVGRGVSFDVDPRHPGAECWAAGPGLDEMFTSDGRPLGRRPRSCNMGIWWDGDLLRELLDGVNIDKWDYLAGQQKRLFTGGQFGCVANNGTKSNPCLSADILGDWREELIARTSDNRELRIFSSAIPTPWRLRTLMHDPQYRVMVAAQNVGYNQPPHPGFFLGAGMEKPMPAGPFPPVRPSAKRGENQIGPGD